MRLRFSIRDLLWLTLVVAMGLGWFVHRQRLQAELRVAYRESKDAVFVAAICEADLKAANLEIRRLEAAIKTYIAATGVPNPSN